MPTVPADPRRPASLLSALVALVLLAGACAGGGPGADDERPGGGARSGSAQASGPGPELATGDAGATPPVVEGLPVPPDLDAAFTELLDRRARALLERDRDDFLAGLEQDDPGFLLAQAGYFDNLAQLPLATLSYDVDPSSLVRRGRSYSVIVEITMQLDGFDALPSSTLDRFRFDQADRRGGGEVRYRLASVTDGAWEEANDIQSQPWEQRPIQVRRLGDVLVVLDEATVGAAEPLLLALERSVADVAARVPYPWDRAVVVYALSDTAFIRSLDDLPGDDPDALDGIAFTVPAGPGDPRTAATRIVLNPRVLTRSETVRDRLLRHELTHVAVGERDDHAPAWLSEGLAEWVSAQALPPAERRIGTEALREARDGVEEMPDDAAFNDGDAALDYAVSWWTCEYLAATYGDTAPWSVLDAFSVPGTPEAPTIQTLLQISPAKLARRATALLVETFAPREPPRDPRRGREE